jgi:hypothetical protein
MTKQPEILPLEYSRAAERLSPIAEGLRKHDEKNGSAAYDIEFLHPDESSVSAHLIHKESGSSVGFLSWDHTTGKSLINVSPVHTKGGFGAARLLTSAWNYAQATGIGGPTDSAIQTVSGWSLQNKLHPEGSGFRSHPWSRPEGVPPKKIEFGREAQEVVPMFKGERGEPELEMSSDAIEYQLRRDQQGVEDRRGRDLVRSNLIHKNILLANRERNNARQPMANATPPSEETAPRGRAGCETCGGTNRVSLVAWGVDATNLQSDIDAGHGNGNSWHWHYPSGEQAGRIATTELVSRFSNGNVTLRNVENQASEAGAEIEFDCPTCRGDN